MMNRIIFLLSLISVLGCNTSKSDLLRFVPYPNGDTYVFELPQGYTKKIISGDHERREEFWYQDSMALYLSTFQNTINYEEVRKIGRYYDWFDAYLAGDSLTLSSKNKKGLYWKDRLIGNGVTIGFTNIPRSELAEFEKSVSSIRRIK